MKLCALKVKLEAKVGLQKRGADVKNFKLKTVGAWGALRRVAEEGRARERRGLPSFYDWSKGKWIRPR